MRLLLDETSIPLRKIVHILRNELQSRFKRQSHWYSKMLSFIDTDG
jgi:hypothetical protein